MPDTKPHTAEAGATGENELTERPRRARVFKKGKLVFQGGLRSVPCVVRNVSEGGALLQFEQAFMLPKEFELRIDLEDYEVTCERRWEDGLKCGVEFVGEKRPVHAQRSQVLKTSEEALKSEIDVIHDSPDNFFTRQRMINETEAADHQAQPVRRTRPAGGGKPGFGKRR